MNKSKMILWSAVADAVSIVIFVAIGRKNHDEGQAASGIFRVAAPSSLMMERQQRSSSSPPYS